jgi:hypothetical protein
MPERHWREALKLARIAPVLVLAAMLCSGCSALGFFAGHSLDTSQQRAVPAAELRTLVPGDFVRLTLSDGTRLAGVVLKQPGDGAGASLAVRVTQRGASTSITEVAGAPTLHIASASITHLTRRVPHTGVSWATVLGVMGVTIDVAFLLELQWNVTRHMRL